MVAIPDSGSPESYRSPFRRDFARIVHTPAFRRLQRKTQLFPGDESDFFRNRMTHSLEVAQIAKSIAIRLNYLVVQKYGDNAGLIDTDLGARPDRHCDRDLFQVSRLRRRLRG